ncbi:helix-turn-helix transcriptional regulator [Streptomyces sp. NPDC005805]|uniref:helix-turn-helix transcriptional regulator n=1 Tax=Streptomyces sp. NPDC005805 TaxID=3157068 RepID=UPI0033FD4289
MNAQEQGAFGVRIAELRRSKGLTQTELAAATGRTASWVSQVERGVQPVNRLDVLRLLADGLDVPLAALRPDAPGSCSAPGEPADTVPVAHNDLDRARLVISGHPALDVLMDSAAVTGDRSALPELRDRAERTWQLVHAGHLAEAGESLALLVPELERFARMARAGEQAEAFRLLARAYQAASAAFARQGEADAAWVAADRAVRAAESGGDALGVGAAVFRLVHAFVRLRRLDQAEHAAETAVRALARSDQGGKASAELLSVLGSLRLALALVHARAGERAAAREQITEARAVARRLGEERNDYNLEFGPVNAEVQAVSTAVDLGDAGEALDLAAGLDVESLSTERRVRLLVDIGRAHAQRRRTGEALEALLGAEELGPDIVRNHPAARAVIRDLVLMAGRGAPPELRTLAERADALG